MPGKVGTVEEWRAARLALLEKEKAHSRAGDVIKRELRELPMVPVDKEYKFHAADGSTPSLADLFDGKSQLIIYHYMFGPDSDSGCSGCGFMAEHIPDVRQLATKDTALACVSRAPVAKLEAFKKRAGWKFPWVSSEGSSFNYDFQATLDETVRPIEYNYKNKAELAAAGQNVSPGGEDMPGLSVFMRGEDGTVYHTYSAYARGLDPVVTTFAFLDYTPKGRQDGPAGPAEFKRRFEYDEEEAKAKASS